MTTVESEVANSGIGALELLRERMPGWDIRWREPMEEHGGDAHTILVDIACGPDGYEDCLLFIGPEELSVHMEHEASEGGLWSVLLTWIFNDGDGPLIAYDSMLDAIDDIAAMFSDEATV